MSTPLHHPLTEPAEHTTQSVRDTLRTPVRPVSMALYTLGAQRLMRGRPPANGKPAILGLFAFADCLRTVWTSAKAWDPYARWWLLRVESAASRAEAGIARELDINHEAMSSFSLLPFDDTHARQPKTFELGFACPYAFWGARLVKQLDVLILELHTATTLGARCRADTNAVRVGRERALRGALASAQGFRNFDLVDADVIKRTPKAIDAELLFGRVPEDILLGREWPSLLVRPSGSTGAPELA